ncbi:MAG: ABC transporter permease [Ferruginibacter sp.]
MFRNYFKIAIRNLAKHKLFSFINIFGLALSMCIGLIVIIRLQDDLSYDHFHPAPERTYRLISEVTNKEGQDFNLASTPLPLADALKDKYAFIEKSARLYPVYVKKASSEKKALGLNMTFTEPAFFDIFGFKLSEGNAATVLNAPNSIVLSKATAKRFFGDQSAIGQSLILDSLGSFLVTGVMAEATEKSHIDYDGYASMSSIPALEKSRRLEANSASWMNLNCAYTYVLLKKGNSPKQLTSALNQITSTYKPKDALDKSKLIFDVQNLSSITPGRDLHYAIGRGPSIGKVAAEVSVALIILISACFNYTNLSLARSLKRSKEVGVRKVSGASRSHIFLQFILEAVIISLLSLGLAYTMMELCKPLQLELFPADTKLNATLIGCFLLFSVFAGLLAGVIPALTLSAFKPVQVLKNLSTVKLFGRGGLRKVLIVFQFSLSLVIIIFMLVFHKQFQYMATGDYGFNRERIINIPLQGTDYHLLKNEIAKISGVERVSATSDNMGKFASGSVRVKQQPADEPVHMRFFDVDEDFVSNMQLKIIAGNNLRPTSGSTEMQILINEKALPTLKIKNAGEAIGKVILLDDTTKVQVAGVVKNFHFEGFEFAIAPLVFRSREQAFNYVNIKTSVDEADAATLVASLRSTWKKFNPHDEFSYSWFNKQFYESKAAEGTVSMLGLLAFMGITIACLGLLGMVVYTVEGRIKEVSIRKVMGASVATIMSLLSKSFLKLVVIAVLIATPIGWICSYMFLQIFAERVTIGFSILSIACSFILLLALVVIGSQVFRVARANPANNLRAE